MSVVNIGSRNECTDVCRLTVSHLVVLGLLELYRQVVRAISLFVLPALRRHSSLG